MASVVVIVVLLLFATVLCSIEWWMYLTVSLHHPLLKAILSHYNSFHNVFLQTPLCDTSLCPK